MVAGQRNDWRVLLEPAAPFLLFLTAFGYLLRAANPSFYLDDSPETATAAVILGIPHPPGYPFHVLLCHLAAYAPLGIPAFRLNLFSACLAASTAVLLARVLKKHFHLDTFASYAMGILWVMGASTFPAALGAKGSVYQLTALLLVFILDCVFSGRWYLAAFLWGLSCAHHWMTLAVFTPGFFLLAYGTRREGEWDAKRAWQMLALALTGVSAYLFLPIRAMADPALNWGDPRTLTNFIFNFRRAQYVAADLGSSPLVWARQAWFFLKNSFIEFPGLFFLSALGAFLGWRRDRGRALGLLALWGGLGLSVSLYLNLTADKEHLITAYILPVQTILILFAGWALTLALEKRGDGKASGGKIVGAFILVFVVTLGTVRFSEERLDRYLYDYDFAINTMKGVPSGSMLFCRGDGLVFPSWYFQMIEHRRQDLVLVGVDGLPMEWVRQHLLKLNPGLKVPMPSWPVGSEAIPSLERGLATANRSRGLYLTYNRVTDGSFPDAKIQPYGLSPRALLPPDQAPFDEAKAQYLWDVMRIRALDQPIDDFTHHNLLNDYAIQRNALGVYYEDLADAMKEGIPGQKPATPEDFQRVYGLCLKSFRWARDFLPDDWEFSFNVGNALYNLNRKSEAMIDYARAAKLNPEATDDFYNWGVAAFETKDFVQAANAFQKTLELDPTRQAAKDGLEYLKKIGFLKEPVSEQQ